MTWNKLTENLTTNWHFSIQRFYVYSVNSARMNISLSNLFETSVIYYWKRKHDCVGFKGNGKNWDWLYSKVFYNSKKNINICNMFYIAQDIQVFSFSYPHEAKPAMFSIMNLTDFILFIILENKSQVHNTFCPSTNIIRISVSCKAV